MEWALRHPIAVIPLFAIVVLWGLLSWPSLPVELLPGFSYPRLVILTSFGQASPEEVEALVTRPIEAAVGTTSGLRGTESVSRNGLSSVVLRFDWGEQMHSIAAEVREKLDLIADELPREVKPPLVLHYNPSEAPILTLALYGAEDSANLRVFAQTALKPELETTAGVAAIRITGGLIPEIQVLADRGRLAAHGIDLRSLVARIKNANINFPGGKVVQGTIELSLRTVGKFRTLDEIRGLPVGRGINGLVVRMEDVADVRETHRDRTGVTRMNGKPVVLLGVIKEPEANTVEVCGRVRARLGELRGRLPQDTRLEVADDQGPFIEDALRDLRNMVLWGGLLALVVLLVALRSPAGAALIMLSIPVSVFSTLGFMALWGVSLNFMSIGGLALGVGMLVDSSIVALESIHRKRLVVANLLEAVHMGLVEVRASVVAGTVTTVVALVPIMFMTGLGRRLFHDFVFTLSGALVMSLFTSLVLLPALVVRMGRNRPRTVEGHVEESRLQLGYGWVLSWTLRRKGTILGLFVIVFLLSAWTIERRGFEVLPNVDQGLFTVNLILPPDSSLKRVERAVRRAEATIKDVPQILTYLSVAGTETNNEPASANEIGKPNEARISIRLRPDIIGSPEIRKRIVDDLRAAFADTPEVEVNLLLRQSFLERVLGGQGSPELLRLEGDDLQILSGLGDRLIEELLEIESLKDLRCEGNVMVEQRRVIVDRYQAAARRLSVSDVAEQVGTAIEGKVAGRFIRKDREIDIRVRLGPKDLRRVEDVTLLPLVYSAAVERDSETLDEERERKKRTQGERFRQEARILPLGRIASLKAGAGPREILRSDRRRSVVVRGNVVGEAFSLGQGRAQRAAEAINLPEGYHVGPGAERFELVSSLSGLAAGLGLAVMLICVVLVIQFESFVRPLVILMTIPMTIAGPALALTLVDIPVSLLVLFGALVLTGIVVNNAILLVTYINQLSEEGAPLEEALILGPKIRLKPILISTFTTVLGALPISLGLGAAATLRQPLALTVTAGLLASLIFTLLAVPILYKLVVGASRAS